MELCPKCKKPLSDGECPTCGSLRKVPKELEGDLMVEPMPCDEDFENPDRANDSGTSHPKVKPKK